MVIYTTPSDIPSSPREPSESFPGDSLMEDSFGAPIEQTKVCQFLCCKGFYSAYQQFRHARPSTLLDRTVKQSLLSHLRLIYLPFFGYSVVNSKLQRRSHNHRQSRLLLRQALKQYLPNLQTRITSNKLHRCKFRNRCNNRRLGSIYRQPWPI